MKSMNKSFLGASIILAVLSGCASKQAQQPELTLSGLNPANFEVSAENAKPIKLYTLKNSQGMEVCVTNFGGRIVSVMVPDKNGLTALQIIRIFQVTSELLSAVMPTESIKGKSLSTDRKSSFRPITSDTVCTTMKSPDGDNNFPGNVTANVTYSLTADNAIDIKYDATTDKTTVINMTNHSYFNLNGDPSKPATDHLLYVASDSITPVDSTFMTTGEMMAVKDTPFDFNTPKAISEGVTDFSNEQVKFGNGFDHNWVLKTKGDINQVAAKLTSPTTGISLEVYTDEPGIQVYTGNFLDGTVKGKKGIVYPQRASVCLETQHYPDSPNKPQWPSVILTPGQTYHSHCIFKFTVEK